MSVSQTKLDHGSDTVHIILEGQLNQSARRFGWASLYQLLLEVLLITIDRVLSRLAHDNYRSKYAFYHHNIMYTWRKIRL
jgi:hypothetical protein